ncbi:fatty-acyl-CoA synthase/O-succinylbenzoic acid--CoA ligase [Tepidamorphus gemmatus]|uniref:Fatty-acyl-CoA synthase/O-succinylbenzoic acid--CoA ligase n=1 Tax=Tepidamorphus gemmatus TaxID=747076 RepID=A0A4R3M5X0_9HYPH|nr:class I adenylate-forming enzyme family protein [Tepidamorphus gemmatus]TCT08432.1 fatty-acyl-CoA synthase/O-succinylbenzoic acid--CoA ligase [Tepidamorphus gemmatus]
MKPISWKSEWLPLVRQHAGRVAVSDARGDVTYADLYAAAAGMAARLLACDVAPGEPVATMLPNGREAVAASLAAALVGAAEAPINPAFAAAEARHCLTLVGARLLLTSSALDTGFAGAGTETIIVEDIAPAAFESLPDIRVDPGTWGRIMFTSGTTGRPKGIVHSHGGRWIANILQRATMPVAAAPGRRILLMTPYAHGASLLTQAFLDGGGSVLLLGGVEPDTVGRVLRAGDVDQIFAPPTVLSRLVEIVEGEEIAGIATIFTGTAPLSTELYARARAIFGPVVRVTFGKTEVFNPITVLTPAETDRWYDDPRSRSSICVGWPASGVEVAIGIEEAPVPESPTGEAPPDQPRVGPVLIRAQHMLIATLTEEGVREQAPGEFHRTGDLGFVDAEGRLHLVGREADVIKTGGYRVTPEEIEAQLRPALPGGEIVVVGLPSSYWGEVIAAAVAGAPAGWEEALAPAIEAMTRFKRPRILAAVPAIPRNPMGKIARSRVRDAILDRYRLIDGRYPRLEAREVEDSTD